MHLIKRNLNKQNKEIASKRFYTGAVTRAKVLNYLLNVEQRAVLLAYQRRMPGHLKKSNTQTTETHPREGGTHRGPSGSLQKFQLRHKILASCQEIY